MADIGLGRDEPLYPDECGSGPEKLPWFDAVLDAIAQRVERVQALWSALGRPLTVHDSVSALVSAPPADAVAPQTNAAFLADPRTRRLTEDLGLSDLEAQFLGLLCAIALRPGLGRALAYIEDEPGPADATPAAAGNLWGWPPGHWPTPSGALARLGLASPLPAGDWRATAAWAAQPDVCAFMAGAHDWWAFWLDQSARRRSTLAEGTDVQGSTFIGNGPDECLYPQLLDEMVAAARAPQRPPLVMEVVGPPGSGRRHLLGQVAQTLGRQSVHCSMNDDRSRALRSGVLSGACVIADVATPQAHTAGPIDEPCFDDRPGALTLIARTSAGQGAPSGAGLPGSAPVARISFVLPLPTRAQRGRLWQHFCPGAPVPAMVRQWSLLPGEILAAATAKPLGDHAVTAACRRQLASLPGSLASPLSCPYGWEDLAVAPDIELQLHQLEDQVRLGPDVLEDWGLRRLTPASAGTAALFAGPSGTGKTMAAQILARSLGMYIYRVDLAQVVDKYIGETEKRLARLFDETERANCVLFFDEADALFGQRTKVRDAHDRFANIEIDYLLARVESFDGVTVLATNRKADLDPAFMRRLRLVVDFRSPTPAERTRLWSSALPPDAPDGSALSIGLDYRWLGDNLELSPAQIKVTALNAAFLARGRGDAVTQDDVVEAARRELAKHGLLLRPRGQL
ncbi:MAG TPA: ATP-binding protein [Acidimicrobiales bacterium]|nr:ATP-binding protein [Acidimicrobiales bacterium]